MFNRNSINILMRYFVVVYQLLTCSFSVLQISWLESQRVRIRAQVGVQSHQRRIGEITNIIIFFYKNVGLVCRFKGNKILQ